MREPQSVDTLEKFGRTRLSKNFFMRDFLYSEIAAIHGVNNIPDDPALAIAAGSRLCEELLEPLQATFGRIAIRSAFRSCALNKFGNENGFSCAQNEKNYAGHIWDRRDAEDCMGATACIVIPWFADRFTAGADWRSLAWWIHDCLPYSELEFFPKFCAFNINWRERPKRRVYSWIEPKGYLTRPGEANHSGDHSQWYEDLPKRATP